MFDFPLNRPVPDEGVLDVAVRVVGWGSPASLHTQQKMSRYLRERERDKPGTAVSD